MNRTISDRGIVGNQRIKVGMYTPFFLPAYGGTENATYNLAKELRALCDIKIYTFNWIPTSGENKNYGLNLSCRLSRRERVDGVCVYRYPIINLPIVKNFSVKLMKDIRSFDIDILHFQGLHRLLSRWLLQKAAKKKIKILTTHALQEAIQIVGRSKYSFLINNFFINSLYNMDHIVALSKTDLRSLLYLGLPKNKITVIPNGIDSKKFNKRRRFVERNGKKKILCVARFDKNKNYESLVYALSKLKKDVFDLEAYFVGAVADYNYFEKIRRLIKKRGLEKIVKIGLSLDDPAVVDCYFSCDVFVLPSRMDTFPLVILEAMYAGLPIIATHVGGIPDIIKNEVNGFLVSPDDSQQLYRRCLQLLKDEKMRSEMGNLNKETAENYTWSKIALSTYNLYQQLVEKNSRQV